MDLNGLLLVDKAPNVLGPKHLHDLPAPCLFFFFILFYPSEFYYCFAALNVYIKLFEF